MDMRFRRAQTQAQEECPDTQPAQDLPPLFEEGSADWALGMQDLMGNAAVAAQIQGGLDGTASDLPTAEAPEAEEPGEVLEEAPDSTVEDAIEKAIPVSTAMELGAAGPSTPLPFRAELEAEYGVDLGAVKVSAGSIESTLALAALEAEAATAGDTLLFMDPHPAKELVAHEVAHLAQTPTRGSAEVHRTSSPSELAEQEATEAAAAIGRGEAAPALTPAEPGTVHRSFLSKALKVVKKVGKAVKDVGSAVGKAVVNTVVKTVKGAIKGAKKGVKRAARKKGGLLGKIWGGIKGGVTGAAKGAKEGVVTGAVDVVRSVNSAFTDGRPLSADEVKLARGTFGKGIATKGIRVFKHSPATAVSGRGLTLGNDIYIPSDQFEQGKDMTLTEEGMVTLAHELTHVWQFQNGGGDYGVDSVARQLGQTLLGKPNPYDYLPYIEKGIPWSKWGAEAQAALVEDYTHQARIDAAAAARQPYTGTDTFNCWVPDMTVHGCREKDIQDVRARYLGEVRTNRGSFGRDDLNARPSVPHVLPARGMGVKFGQRRR